MRDRMERFVLLPFSIGCVSESSVAIGIHHDSRSTSKHLTSKKEEDEESLSSTESMKSSMRPLALPKPNISNGFQKLVKGFKTFFVYEEEAEIEEVEMEIGDPTDVKHVTHIGLDGSSTSTSMSSSSCPIQGWEHLISPSLSQFELKPLVN